MYSVGLIGLPNSGKSTFFKAITHICVPISNFPFTTIDPNHGIVKVKDKRLEKIAEVIKPEKTTLPYLEFVDIAGLVKGANEGKGLGNQFLSHIQETDLLLEIVRAFESEKVSHENSEINPSQDIQTIENEILKRDLRIIKQALQNKEFKQRKEILEKIKDILQNNKWLGEYLKISKNQTPSSLPKASQESSNDFRKEIKELCRELGIISIKPKLRLINIGDQAKADITIPSNILCANLRNEEEILSLSEEEQKEIGTESQLDRIISACYNKLQLITFYTIKGGKEARAFKIKEASSIIEAAEKVHSDFKKNFIRAEVLFWKKLIEIGSWQKAKREGEIEVKGRSHKVKDGEIIEFKI